MRARSLTLCVCLSAATATSVAWPSAIAMAQAPAEPSAPADPAEPPQFTETPVPATPTQPASPESERIVPVKGGYALEGSPYRLTKAELWTLLDQPEQVEHFRRQRVWAGVSMAPGIAVAVAGVVWLLVQVDSGCISSGDVDNDEDDNRCPDPATRSELAAFGLVAGGILLTLPGAILIDKERRVLKREVEAYNRKRSPETIARPRVRFGRPNARGLGVDLRLTWTF